MIQDLVVNTLNDTRVTNLITKFTTAKLIKFLPLIFGYKTMKFSNEIFYFIYERFKTYLIII